MAKGFLQVYGVDYVETFAPVVRYKSIRMILVLASQYGLVIHQIDYKTAFLNATLTESIYMEQPTGYSTGRDYVWKLNKAIYGLKQSPMEWNHEIDSTLKTLGYNPTVSDPCVYIKLAPNYPPIILALYVDDTIIAIHPNLMDQWEQDRQAIAATYPITDLGVCRWILNMELMVTPDPVTGKCIYTLSQHPYVIKLLDKFNMTDCNPVQALTLFANLSDPKQDPGHALTMDQHSLYRQIVGAVLYLANTTRMDISYAVSTLSCYLAEPKSIHLTAAKHLLRYLKGTVNYKMEFKPEPELPISLHAYSDADWAGNKTDRRSTTGMIIQLCGNTISWNSNKQSTVALSSAESEYMALAATFQEIIWCMTWIEEVVGSDTPIDTQVFGDSQSAIAMVRSSAHHDRSKHIDIRYHFIKDWVKRDTIKLNWIPTDQQLADMMTKALPKVLLHKFRDQLLVKD